ncbi:hypothetical protein F2Q68_00042190 [Brassica cretica]|uniref:Uncharacterized protein n=1 Tax=Brassica cretica TaxID=69181 RepID=A0A8S9MGL3_BRACR|nr:hypothetical protein F2Q68_00042190 [Brassica cretica]
MDKTGLQRCGKSCRLRWLNYLRPGIKRGKFTPQEEEEIIKLHAVLGNRWAAIAKEMDNRTDNDIKNHWNSCLKKRLSRKGIDPMTHEPIINNLTVTITNEECGSSSITTFSPTSSPSGSLHVHAIAKEMDNRTDNDIKNHWNSCLKKRLSRKGIDPMTHEPIINNLTVTITNEECGSSSITTFSPTSSPSGSACLLNKLATGISSRHHDLDRIKSILLEPRIASSDQDEKEEVKRDHTIGGGEEGDDSLIWDDEEVRRFMESDEMEYGTTPYVSLFYESTHVLDDLL